VRMRPPCADGFPARRAGAGCARRTRSRRRATAGHSKWVTSVAWEPAHAALPCRRLASGSKDCAVRVWDARTRRCLFSMGSHTKAVSCVRWAGDGHIISSARDCAIFVWDAQARAWPRPAEAILLLPPRRCLTGLCRKH